MSTKKENGRTKDCVNKKYRQPHADNLRYSGITGKKLATAAYWDENGMRAVDKCIGDASVPLKILPYAAGAPSVRRVVFKGNETIVIFDNGDRISVCRSEGDAFDHNTAVGWALLKYILGNSVGRRIAKIVETLGVDAERERDGRDRRKDAERAARNEKIAKKLGKGSTVICG